MKKSVKATIIACAAIIVVAAAVFGGIAIHDKTEIKNAKESLSVTNVTIELQKSDATVTVDDVLNKNNVECTALFSNNAGSIEINASEVNEYTEQLTVSLLKPICFNEEIKFDVRISVADTTAPEFTESIEEIKITEGDEINILDYFKAEDFSGDVNLSVTEFDHTKIGEQTVIVAQLEADIYEGGGYAEDNANARAESEISKLRNELEPQHNIKFVWNGIKIDGQLYKGKYSIGPYTETSMLPEGTVTIYMDTSRTPRNCGLEIKNESDSMTDYFENDTVRIRPGTIHYDAAVKATNAITFIWKRLQ